MILEVSPDSSMLVRGAATTILYLHIGGGLIGILSGAAALLVKKGGPLHRKIGNVFFVSMLIMAVIGAVVSPFLPVPDWVNVVGGVFAFYLVVTARLTMQRAKVVGHIEHAVFISAVLIAVFGIGVGVAGIKFPGSVGDGSSGPALVFGAIAALAAVGDLKMIRQGGVQGRQRVSRHLWRMCLALFIAVGSLFGGQPQLFPDWIRDAGLLNVPVLATLVALIFWMLRVRFAKRWQIG